MSLSSPFEFDVDAVPAAGHVAPMAALVRTVQPSEIRRHKRMLIVGDVHGCYNELIRLCTTEIFSAQPALQPSAAQASPPPDALIVLVGDLVHKGPESAAVVAWARALAEDGRLLAIRGNHENMALEAIDAADTDECEEAKAKDTGSAYAWCSNLTEDDRAWLRALPYALSFPWLGLLVVHAGLVPGVPLAQQRHEDLVNLRDLAAPGGGASRPWAQVWTETTTLADAEAILDSAGGGAGGDGGEAGAGCEGASGAAAVGAISAVVDVGAVSAAGVAGAAPTGGGSGGAVRHVFFGHDAPRGLQQYSGDAVTATGLDTACVNGGRLTGWLFGGDCDEGDSLADLDSTHVAGGRLVSVAACAAYSPTKWFAAARGAVGGSVSAADGAVGGAVGGEEDGDRRHTNNG